MRVMALFLLSLILASDWVDDGLLKFEKGLKKRGLEGLEKTEKYAYQKKIETETDGCSRSYHNIFDSLSELVDSVNVVNGTDWDACYDLANDYYFVRDKNDGLNGIFDCISKKPNEMIFYAEGFYYPQSKTSRFIIQAGSLGKIQLPIRGRAYFVIKYRDNNGKVEHDVQFYLTTENKLANKGVKVLAGMRAEKIFKSVVKVFEIIASKSSPE
jgi:hypothetical protein